MSGMYGPTDRAECLATLHAAVDAGINLVDTGDFYGMMTPGPGIIGPMHPVSKEATSTPTWHWSKRFAESPLRST
jgi:hypothetical protein